MKASVALHVREDVSRVVVTPIPFVDLAVDAPSFAQAAALVRPSLEARIGALEPVDRLPFFGTPHVSVHRSPVAFPIPDTNGGAIEIAIGVVVVRRIVRGRMLLLGYAPVIPHLQLAARDGDVEQLVARVGEACRGRMRSWQPEHVMNADEPESSRLEILELDVETAEADAMEDGRVRSSRTRNHEILDELGVDLSRREDGRIDEREELVERALETLAAPGRSSILLVGPPDVGKSALVHEIARRVAAGACPESLRGRRVYRLSANELIAGAQYIGQWQERARRFVDAASSGAVVAMGDPMGVIDAGRWSKSDSGLARFLRPYVETGEITLICESTPDQLAAAQREDAGFVGALHRIDVHEPGPHAVGPIVAAAAAHLGGAAGVTVDEQGIAAAVELTRRFEPYRGFPGKAVRLLEDAMRERPDGTATLGRREVTAAFARRSGLPLALLSDDVQFRMAEVREHFGQRVLGQPRATSTVADLVAVLKSGLSDPSKPLASYFFVGPTGVGKTELTKALAEFLFGSRDRLVRFDMAEYASPDAVQRLVGTAWGSSEGELTRRVREQPFCVVLLDEIEKAHQSVFDALLGVIGEGRLTDAAGRVADFRSAIVIMTSNLGARGRSAALGFGGESALPGDRYVEEAERFFRPEFFNRIDRVVVFHPLAAATVEQIARLELERLLTREGIVRRKLRVEVDDAVVGSVAAAGFHPRYGARPLHREIERSVIEPLARLLVDRRPTADEFVRVCLRDGRVAVSIERVSDDRTADARRTRPSAKGETSFARSERLAADFQTSLLEDDAARSAEQARAEISALVRLANERSFWNDAVSARETLHRIYRLELVVGRFDALCNRAAGLVEMARRVREARHRARAGEVPRAVNEMADELVVVRLELAAAVGGGTRDVAVVRVVPIGAESAAWAGRLLAMYEAWAARTGREVTRAGDGAGAVVIEGPATLDILVAEAGLHRHVLLEGAEELARVSVAAPGEAPPDSSDPGLVVRVYEDGRRRVVRDPTTGARDSRVAAVLDEGRLEAFLIAGLGRAPVVGRHA